MVPGYSGDITLTCTQIKAIEAGLMTFVEPPSSFITRSTISSVNIIVTILGSKLHLIVPSKRISSVTFQEYDKTTP